VFFRDTYEVKGTPNANSSSNIDVEVLPNTVPYLRETDHGHRVRKVCRQPHNTLCRFHGQWFPSRDNESVAELYAASMLALLKPWRSFSDLKPDSQTFASAFKDWKATASPDVFAFLANIQFFHDAANSAKEQNSHNEDVPFDEDDTVGVDRAGMVGYEPFPETEWSEEDVITARTAKVKADLTAFGGRAVDIARHAGYFTHNQALPAAFLHSPKALPSDLATFNDLGSSLKSSLTDDGFVLAAPHIALTNAQSSALPGVPIAAPSSRSDTDVSNAYVALLNAEQLRAYNIIVNHAQAARSNVPTPQLLMLIHGHGSTGKTLLLNAISATFKAWDCSHQIAKTATSGIAAANFSGMTLHYWLAMPITLNWNKKASKASQVRRNSHLGRVCYVFIDECSMLTKKFLGSAERLIAAIRRSMSFEFDDDIPFAGLNIILLGDFHQFPPVGNEFGALYVPEKPNSDEYVC